jgi:hypothetical protein
MGVMRWAVVINSRQGRLPFSPKISDLFWETRGRELSPCLILRSSHYRVLYSCLSQIHLLELSGVNSAKRLSYSTLCSGETISGPGLMIGCLTVYLVNIICWLLVHISFV